MFFDVILLFIFAILLVHAPYIASTQVYCFWLCGKYFASTANKSLSRTQSSGSVSLIFFACSSTDLPPPFSEFVVASLVHAPPFFSIFQPSLSQNVHQEFYHSLYPGISLSHVLLLDLHISRLSIFLANV